MPWTNLDRRIYREAGHLVRLLVVVIVALSLFLVVRAAVIPAFFGQYGHYRPGALDDNRKRAVSYAGQDSCLNCHDDVQTSRKGGGHEKIHCEACHGPQAKHAEDPSAVKPQLPSVERLCARCHEADAAKPRGFPQVVSKEHSMGADCTGCHQPHKPKP